MFMKTKFCQQKPTLTNNLATYKIAPMLCLRGSGLISIHVNLSFLNALPHFYLELD